MVNRNGLMKRRWEQASYTVEAAFVVPLGFLVLMSLSCLFTGAVKQNNVQMALLKTVQAYGMTQSRTSALQGIADQKVLIRWEEQGGEEFGSGDTQVAPQAPPAKNPITIMKRIMKRF